MLGFPPAGPGQIVGLFGGSFDPAHDGHAHVAETALRAARLDHLWWVVSADHAFKRGQGLFGDRLASARTKASGPKQVVTDIEARLDVGYSVDLLRALQARSGDQVRYVWVMGADALAEFHRWKDWRDIAARAPILIVSRPGAPFAALKSPAARALKPYRVRPENAAALVRRGAPGWAFLPAPLHTHKSREMRGI